MLDELRAMLTSEQQKVKLEQIENCQLSLIALSEKDAYIEGFKLGCENGTRNIRRYTASGMTNVSVPAVSLFNPFSPIPIQNSRYEMIIG